MDSVGSLGFHGACFYFLAFRCNFDNNMCGFTQDKDDQFDWTRLKGQTQTSKTGPFGDHTGGGK